jgi:hypothetical protein
LGADIRGPKRRIAVKSGLRINSARPRGICGRICGEGFLIDALIVVADLINMTAKCGLTREHVLRILGGDGLEQAAKRLRPDTQDLPWVPAGSAKVSAEHARAPGNLAAIGEKMAQKPDSESLIPWFFILDFLARFCG